MLSYSFRTAPEGLLGIELDDKLLFEIEIDILSLRKSYNLSCMISYVVLKPLGSSMSSEALKKLLNLYALKAGLLNSDNIACLDKERRNSNLLTVEGKVCVKNKLTSFLSGCCHTHSVYYVIKSSLKKNEKVCTGDAFLLLSKLIVVLELTLKNAVVTSSLLLLTKLLSVLTNLLTSCTVLTGSLSKNYVSISLSRLLDGALAAYASVTLKVKLAALAAAKLTVRTCISSHFSNTSLLIKRVCA